MIHLNVLYFCEYFHNFLNTERAVAEEISPFKFDNMAALLLASQCPLQIFKLLLLKNYTIYQLII